MALKNSRIADLVNQNNIRAYVLYYFGIRFYEYSEETLEQVCSEKGLKIENVVRELESPGANFQEADLPLVSYPIDLIIEYLKHAHFLFVKHRLPYIARLVESFKAGHNEYLAVEKDLKVLLPLFIEDFIHHIYEEEDTLFTYIRLLERALHGSCNISELYYKMELHSLDKFSLEHEEHDDEMRGIRRITRDYFLSSDAPLHVKVIYSELRQFERNLKTHARIENGILFPRALELENQVKMILMEKAKYN